MHKFLCYMFFFTFNGIYLKIMQISISQMLT